MGEVFFCETEDGSIGLFNNDVNDIYHSTHGAYSESYEKFLLSSGFLEFIQNNEKIKILDICYGIGYNSKVALNEILKLDRILDVKIDALEYDKNLILISPFLKNQLVDNAINHYLIDASNLNENISILEILKIFIRLKGIKHINLQNLLLFYLKNKQNRYKTYPLKKITGFLHNIYYNYVSFRFKNGQKANKLANTSFSIYSDDARKSILTLDTKYDFIFLDAFTPKKLPTLWSYEFFKELYRLLDDNGVLITYSSSAAVRGAMIKAGFYIGCSLDKNNKRIGTMAVKNKSLIKNELSEFDLGLIKTKAGIFYRDENLNASKEQIIALRENEVNSSTRITSSRYKKDYEKK